MGEGEENWPENVVRSKGVVRVKDFPGLYDALGGEIIHDGPRYIICAECGAEMRDGLVVHQKPRTYAIAYEPEEGCAVRPYYLERHIGVSCGCAAKWGLA